jgi:hypothetical protein
VKTLYASSTDYKDEAAEIFYSQLEEVFDEIPKQYAKVVPVDWSAKIEKDNQDWDECMMSE